MPHDPEVIEFLHTVCVDCLYTKTRRRILSIAVLIRRPVDPSNISSYTREYSSSHHGSRSSLPFSREAAAQLLAQVLLRTWYPPDHTACPGRCSMGFHNCANRTPNKTSSKRCLLYTLPPPPQFLICKTF
jgi:hypothetical protein